MNDGWYGLKEGLMFVVVVVVLVVVAVVDFSTDRR